MNKIAPLVGIVLFLGCTPGRAPMPAFSTPDSRECGIQCRRGRQWCLDATCPAKARSSCRPKCNRKLEECYQACLEGEQAGSGLRRPGRGD